MNNNINNSNDITEETAIVIKFICSEKWFK